MTDQEKREKVIKGMECCLPPHDPDCDICPYDSIDLRCRAKLRDDILAMLKALSAFKAYFDDLYGKGLEVANWHMNGATEPFDSFYDSAIEEMQHD